MIKFKLRENKQSTKEQEQQQQQIQLDEGIQCVDKHLNNSDQDDDLKFQSDAIQEHDNKPVISLSSAQILAERDSIGVQHPFDDDLDASYEDEQFFHIENGIDDEAKGYIQMDANAPSEENAAVSSTVGRVSSESVITTPDINYSPVSVTDMAPRNKLRWKSSRQSPSNSVVSVGETSRKSFIAEASSTENRFDLREYFRKITRPSDSSGSGDIGISKKIKLPPQQLWQSVATIVLVSGRNLMAMDDNGLSDPYVRFKLGPERYKSKCKTKTLTPRWLEQFDLYVYTDQSSSLELSVFDRDVGGRDEFMGRAELDLSILEREVTHNVEAALEDYAGYIQLLITISGQSVNSAQTLAATPSFGSILFDTDTVKHYSLLRTLGNIQDIGCLKVRVIRAQGLAAVDLGGTSDPYLVLELVNTRLRTHTEYKTLAPQWERTFTMNIKDIHSVLDITVYDSNKDKKSEFLGRISIPLLKIKQNEVRTLQLKDQNLCVRAKGTIKVQLSFVYNPIRAAVRTINPREEKYMQAEPKFKIILMKRNIDRVSRIVNAVTETGRFLNSCFLWESTTRSSIAFIIFLVVVWNIELYMIPASLVALFLKHLLVENMVGFIRRDADEDAMYMEDEDEEEDKDSKDEKKNQSFREKLASIQGVLLNVQESMDTVASMGERIKNTFRWSVPWLTTLAMIALTVVSMLLYYIPLRCIVLAWGLNKFTKKLRKPDAIDNNELLDFLSRVPTDREMIQYSELKPDEQQPVSGSKRRRRLEARST